MVKGSEVRILPGARLGFSFKLLNHSMDFSQRCDITDFPSNIVCLDVQPWAKA